MDPLNLPTDEPTLANQLAEHGDRFASEAARQQFANIAAAAFKGVPDVMIGQALDAASADPRFAHFFAAAAATEPEPEPSPPSFEDQVYAAWQQRQSESNGLPSLGLVPRQPAPQQSQSEPAAAPSGDPALDAATARMAAARQQLEASGLPQPIGGLGRR